MMRANRLRRFIGNNSGSAEAPHVATPPDRAGLERNRPRDYRHASWQAWGGNRALRLRMLLQVNRQESPTPAVLA